VLKKKYDGIGSYALYIIPLKYESKFTNNYFKNHFAVSETKVLFESNGNDEIGLLVKEYHRTIRNLENSRILLAKTHRESAWREMANEVAYQNPLTTMKLSVQIVPLLSVIIALKWIFCF
jgi:hypothetical protein